MLGWVLVGSGSRVGGERGKMEGEFVDRRHEGFLSELL